MSDLLNWKTIGSNERDDMLRRYIAEGLSARRIADQFQDCTRSAVIGRAHRLNLSIRGGCKSNRSSKSKSSVPSAPRSPNPKPNKSLMKVANGLLVPIPMRGSNNPHRNDFKGRAEQRAAAPGLEPHLISGDARRVIDDIPMPVSRRLQLVDLTTHTCKWPSGDPQSSDFSFCGNEAGEGSSYCPYHSRLSYGAPTPSQSASLRAAIRIR